MLCAVWCLTAHGARVLQFKNFSNQVDLRLVRDDTYEVIGTAERVNLSGDIIIKTPASIEKPAAYKLYSSISAVTTLYESTEFNYFLLQISNVPSLQNALKILSEHESVWLAQPDILQVRETASISAATNPVHNDYLERLDAPMFWNQTLGEGVKVAIIDDGFDLSHPDLQHVNQLFSYDFSSKSLNARPKFHEDRHGAMVAGVIFGGHNGFGLDGLAPHAELIALRQADTWTSKTLLAFQLAKLTEADVINCSWTSRWLMEPVADVVQDMARNGRNKKGMPIIFSAGNQGREIQPKSTEAALDEAIVVGASANNGTRLKYSNYGKSVDFLVSGVPVETTSGRGGYDAFSGTSLAAAIAKGYVALLLSQDGSLTLEQINNKLREELVAP